MSKLFYPLLVFICFSCYSHHSNSISHHIKEVCQDNDECIFELSDVYDFPWDTMYIFSSYTFPQDVSSELGVDYQGDIVPDDLKLVIFTLDGEIISESYDEFRKVQFVKGPGPGVMRIGKGQKLGAEVDVNNGKKLYLIFLLYPP
ncbi:MAG: hypothetical protein AAFR66_04005 [Bacteroidota bacterium]